MNTSRVVAKSGIRADLVSLMVLGLRVWVVEHKSRLELDRVETDVERALAWYRLLNTNQDGR